MGDESTGHAEALRPSPAAYRAWLRQSWFPAFVPVCLYTLGAGWLNVENGVEPLSLTVLVAGGGAVAWVVASIVTTRVVLAPGRVEHRRWVVLRPTVATDTVRGILTPLSLPGSARTPDVLVLQSGVDGRKVRLHGAFWDHGALVRIAEHAGVRVSEQVMTIADVEDELPGILMWRERHWVPGSILLLTGLAAGVAAVVLSLLAAAGAAPFD